MKERAGRGGLPARPTGSSLTGWVERVRAPEIDLPEIEWFNVDSPLSLAALRGRAVLLDFWTFCCINCIQILPSLQRVEEAFPEEAVVVGVHSPKFAAERDARNVAAAIARYGIRHPVAHDPGMRIWRAYGVAAWPTLAFVAPDGTLAGKFSGEPDSELLVRAVADLVIAGERQGSLAPAPFPLAPVEDGGGRFRFPGKMKRLTGGEASWALADSGHHRIALLDAGGGERARYGSGEAGFRDGPAGEARFRDPQGLVAGDGAVYVADTGNHAIRRIDLAKGRVTTLAGTGERGGALGDPVPGKETALASVWDLELKDGSLYFANAGTHQLGELDLATGAVRRLAGTGGENIRDGRADRAELAQPSGLALDARGHVLYFADSETSSVRALSLGDRRVSTLVGTGLFDFGHANGPFGQARFQHPLGIAWRDGRLYVADSYNGALRVLDLAAQEVRDFDDGGFVCNDPVCLPLAEPAGVAAAPDGRLYLVDTNHHRVLAYDLAGKTYRTWAG